MRTGFEGRRPWFLIAAAILLIGTALATLAVTDANPFRARLSVTEAGAVLRHTLGLRRRRIGTVQRLESGSAYQLRPDPVMSGNDDAYSNVESPAGSYLRLRGRRRGITVRCKTSALRKVWTGWQRAPRRRRWDSTLTPSDFAALQYVLAEQRLLTLRQR